MKTNEENKNINYEQQFKKNIELIYGSLDCLKIAYVCKTFLKNWYLEHSNGESILLFIRKKRHEILHDIYFNKNNRRFKRSEDIHIEQYIIKMIGL